MRGSPKAQQARQRIPVFSFIRHYIISPTQKGRGKAGKKKEMLEKRGVRSCGVAPSPAERSGGIRKRGSTAYRLGQRIPAEDGGRAPRRCRESCQGACGLPGRGPCPKKGNPAGFPFFGVSLCLYFPLQAEIALLSAPAPSAARRPACRKGRPAPLEAKADGVAAYGSTSSRYSLPRC